MVLILNTPIYYIILVYDKYDDISIITTTNEWYIVLHNIVRHNIIKPEFIITIIVGVPIAAGTNNGHQTWRRVKHKNVKHEIPSEYVI